MCEYIFEEASKKHIRLKCIHTYKLQNSRVETKPKNIACEIVFW